jgi:hypothetical protein
MHHLDKRPSTGQQLRAFLRGAFIGIIGVVAIAVWAINLDVVLTGNAGEGMSGRLIRLILCDAIPLATLITIYRGIATDRNAESVLRSIVGSLFWFVGRRKAAAEPLRFHDEVDFGH